MDDRALLLGLFGSVPDDVEEPIRMAPGKKPLELLLIRFLPMLASIGGRPGIQAELEKVARAFETVKAIPGPIDESRKATLKGLVQAGARLAKLDRGAARVMAVLAEQGWQFDAEKGAIKDLPGYPVANRPPGLYVASVQALYVIESRPRDIGNTADLRERIAQRLPASLPTELLDTRRGKPLSNAIKNYLSGPR